MKRLLTGALLGFLLVSCTKNNDDQSAAGGDFTSYQQYDVNGNRLGSVGNASDDYKMETWPQWVYDLFLPLDTVSLKGYVESEVSVDALYPNPCGDNQVFQLFATQPVNLKMAIVDPFRKVYFLKSVHVPSAQQSIALDYRELLMPGNTYYRMFYSFSAEGKPHFMRGHIDIYKK